MEGKTETKTQTVTAELEAFLTDVALSISDWPYNKQFFLEFGPPPPEDVVFAAAPIFVDFFVTRRQAVSAPPVPLLMEVQLVKDGTHEPVAEEEVKLAGPRTTESRGYCVYFANIRVQVNTTQLRVQPLSEALRQRFPKLTVLTPAFRIQPGRYQPPSTAGAAEQVLAYEGYVSTRSAPGDSNGEWLERNRWTAEELERVYGNYARTKYEEQGPRGSGTVGEKVGAYAPGPELDLSAISKLRPYVRHRVRKGSNEFYRLAIEYGAGDALLSSRYDASSRTFYVKMQWFTGDVRIALAYGSNIDVPVEAQRVVFDDA